jgi:hypothetical protein
MSLVFKDAGDFITGLSIMGFAFLANFFYTFGWIVELSLRFVNRIKAASFGLKSFRVGFIIAICGTFVPPLFFGITGLIKGEKVSSPYAHFAKTQPKWNDIAGEYKLADISKMQLHFPDSLANKFIFRLNADSTFILENFPYYSSAMSISEYEIVNATGKWSIEKIEDTWLIPMHFQEIRNIISNFTIKVNSYDMGFNVTNDKPPYEIYITVGDPDSWEGVTLQKRNSPLTSIDKVSSGDKTTAQHSACLNASRRNNNKL